MKKFFVILFVLTFLTACNTNGGNADDQKKIDGLNQEVNELQQRLDQLDNAKAEDQVSVVQEETPASTIPTPTPTPVYTGTSFINILQPQNGMNEYTEPIIFNGEVSPNTVKVGVKASNGNSAQVDDYILQNYKAGDKTFTYRAMVEYNNLVEGTNTYIFTAYFADGSSKNASVTLYYTSGGAEMGKPVIYLYPKEEGDIFVNVQPTDGITVSEPTLNDGWHVHATPDGKITNLADGKDYPYLFWEGYAKNFVTPKEGFVVSTADVSRFFDEKLAVLGLNTHEITDFKEFWMPKFQDKPYYFVTFIDQMALDGYAPLTVEPKPDSVIRIFFDYKGLDAKLSVPEQILTKVVRYGFSVVEWGGRLY